MILAPLSASVIVDRVTSLCPKYSSVQDAISAVQVAESGQFRSPGAFVLEPSYSPVGDPNGSGGSLVQELMVEVGILTGVTDMRDKLAGPNAAVMRDARAQLWEAMVGWAVFGIGEMEFQLGICRPFGYRDSTYWFLDSFRLMRQLRATIGG